MSLNQNGKRKSKWVESHQSPSCFFKSKWEMNYELNSYIIKSTISHKQNWKKIKNIIGSKSSARIFSQIF